MQNQSGAIGRAVEFRLLARPRYVAKANLSLLTPLIGDALAAPRLRA